MARKKKVNDYGTRIPYHEVEALARVLLPEIQAYFESEEGQREYAEWKSKKEAASMKLRTNTGAFTTMLPYYVGLHYFTSKLI